MDRALKLWQELQMPHIVFKAPWHGYLLGDWSDSWEKFAQNSTAGKWKENGLETYARRRGGLKPETSVREVEK